MVKVKNADRQKKFVSIGEAEAFTGMGQAALQRLYQEGVLKGYTTPFGARRFSTESLQEFCSISDTAQTDKLAKVNYLYARVSSKKQSDDLGRQVKFLQDWAVDKELTYVVIEDIGSGINFKRKGLQTILDRCLQGVIGDITIAHRDRLSIFGFDLIESIVSKAGGTITIIDDNKNKSSEQELADDLLSIVHIYSCRQMGKRSYKNKTPRTTEDTDSNISTDAGTKTDVGQESTCE